jgi:hypothetical protein
MVLNSIKDKNSPEYRFIKTLSISIIVTNIVAILIIAIFIFLFTRRIIYPIKEVTNKIKTLEI